MSGDEAGTHPKRHERVAGGPAAPEIGVNMGIGLGIVLLLAGVILVSDVVNFDMNYVDDNGLGWILIVVGALAIVLALIMNAQRNRSTTRVERRIEE
jgi:hypothetical protein